VSQSAAEVPVPFELRWDGSRIILMFFLKKLVP
jgi:hypothetical protein